MLTKEDLEQLGFINPGMADIASILRRVNNACPDVPYFNQIGDRRHRPTCTLKNGNLSCLGVRDSACDNCPIRVPCYEVQTDTATFWRFPTEDVRYIPGPDESLIHEG